LTSLVLSLGVSLVLAGAEPDWFPGVDEDVLRGDANNSGSVTISDPYYIQSFLFQGGGAPPCMTAADANDDGQVDNSDAIYLYDFLLMGGPCPPAPYPYCGDDPTEDDLTCENSTCL
jgi:hypothetical protein